MGKITYGLSGGIDEKNVGLLLERACQMLQATGIAVSNLDIRDHLGKCEGFHVSADTVKIETGSIQKMIEAVRLQNHALVIAENYEVKILSGYPIYVEDISVQKTRFASTEDAIRLTKLVDGLYTRGVRGSTPVVPQDIAPNLRHLACYMIGAQYCSHGAEVSIGAPDTAQALIPMMEVMGQEPELGVFIVNPLRAEGDTFDTLHLYHHRFKRFTVGCMPMMGLTAPITIFGTLVIAIASVLASMMIVRSYEAQAEFEIEARCWPVDMRTLNVAYGMPEMIFGDLCYSALCKFFRWQRNGCKDFHSNAVFSDAQANGQRAAYAMAMALSGQRKFQFGGLLATDMVFSQNQLMYDIELLRYIKYVTDGFEASKKALDMDTIFSVGARGSYLMEDDTLENYMTTSFFSDIWCGQAIAQELDHKPLQAEVLNAHEEAERIIAQHEFVLDNERVRALENIFAAWKAKC